MWRGLPAPLVGVVLVHAAYAFVLLALAAVRLADGTADAAMAMAIASPSVFLVATGWLAAHPGPRAWTLATAMTTLEVLGALLLAAQGTPLLAVVPLVLALGALGLPAARAWHGHTVPPPAPAGQEPPDVLRLERSLRIGGTILALSPAALVLLAFLPSDPPGPGEPGSAIVLLAAFLIATVAMPLGGLLALAGYGFRKRRRWAAPLAAVAASLLLIFCIGTILGLLAAWWPVVTLRRVARRDVREWMRGGGAARANA